jgi:hypothetical protein
MAGHRIIQTQLSPFLEQQDSRRGKCLGHRRDVEAGPRLVDHAQLVVRHPIALVYLHPSSSADQDHAGEVVAGDVGPHEAVDPLLERAWRGVLRFD